MGQEKSRSATKTRSAPKPPIPPTVKSWTDIQRERKERFLKEPSIPLTVKHPWTNDHNYALRVALKNHHVTSDICAVIKDCVGCHRCLSITYDADVAYAHRSAKLKDKDDFKVFVSGAEGCGKTSLIDFVLASKAAEQEFGNDRFRTPKMMFMEEFSGDHFSTSDMMYESRSRKGSDVILKVFTCAKGRQPPCHSTECGVIVRNVFGDECERIPDAFYRTLVTNCLKYHTPYVEVNAKTGHNLDVMMQSILMQFVMYGAV